MLEKHFYVGFSCFFPLRSLYLDVVICLQLQQHYDNNLGRENDNKKTDIFWKRSFNNFDEARWLFLSHFWPLLKQVSFFEASGAVVKPMRSYKEYVARVRTPKIKNNNNVQTYKMNYKSVEVQWKEN